MRAQHVRLDHRERISMSERGDSGICGQTLDHEHLAKIPIDDASGGGDTDPMIVDTTLNSLSTDSLQSSFDDELDSESLYSVTKSAAAPLRDGTLPSRVVDETVVGAPINLQCQRQ